MAEAGAELETLMDACRSIGSNLGTMGIALGPCSLPGSERSLFDVDEDKIEVGLGVHGEHGIGRVPVNRANDNNKN